MKMKMKVKINLNILMLICITSCATIVNMDKNSIKRFNIEQSLNKKKIELHKYGFFNIHLFYSYNIQNKSINILKYSFNKEYEQSIVNEIYKLNYQNIKKEKTEIYDFISYKNNKWIYPYDKDSFVDLSTDKGRLSSSSKWSDCLSIYHNSSAIMTLIGTGNTVRIFDNHRLEYIGKLITQNNYNEVQNEIISNYNKKLEEKKEYAAKRNEKLNNSAALFYSILKGYGKLIQKNAPIIKCKGLINIRVEFGSFLPTTATKFIVSVKGISGSYYKDEKKGGSSFFESSNLIFTGLCEGTYEIKVSAYDDISKDSRDFKKNYKYSGGKKGIVFNLTDSTIYDYQF